MVWTRTTVNKRELFNFANKGYSLRNADFDKPRYSTVIYGKHTVG